MADAALHTDKQTSLERLSWGLLFFLSGGMIFSIALAQTAAVLLIVTVGLRLALRQGPPFRRTPLDVPLALFVVIRGLSIAFSVDPSRSASALHAELLFYLLVPAVTNTISGRDPDEVRKVLLAAVIGGAVAAVIGTFKVLIGWEARATSTSGGYYTLGIYLAAVLPILCVMGGTPRFLPRVPVWGGGVAVIGIGIIATFNRLHWGAAAITLLLAGFFRERRIVYGAAIVGVLLLIAVPGVTERLEQAFNPTANMSGRDVIWKGAAMVGGERPILGYGPRTFSLIFPLFNEIPDKEVGSWHNDYLQIYMESGILGLGALLWLLWAGVAPLIRACRGPGTPPAAGRLLLAILASLGFFVLFGGMFDVLVGLLFKTVLASGAVLAVAAQDGNR